MENISPPRAGDPAALVLPPPTITAAALLAVARDRGVSALGAPPVPGMPCKVLLASMVDVANPLVQSHLVLLNRVGAIVLTRVDALYLIPADRVALYQASRFWSVICWFDSIAFDGALLA